MEITVLFYREGNSIKFPLWNKVDPVPLRLAFNAGCLAKQQMNTCTPVHWYGYGLESDPKMQHRCLGRHEGLECIRRGRPYRAMPGRPVAEELCPDFTCDGLSSLLQ